MIRKISVIEKCAIKYRNEKFSPYGINGCDHPYLLCISKFKDISQDELSERIIVNKSNTARTLSRLENDGFIKRNYKESDKRVLVPELTEKGKELIPTINKINNDWEEYLLSDLSEEEQKVFLELLHKVYLKAVKYVRDK